MNVVHCDICSKVMEDAFQAAIFDKDGHRVAVKLVGRQKMFGYGDICSACAKDIVANGSPIDG